MMRRDYIMAFTVALVVLQCSKVLDTASAVPTVSPYSEEGVSGGYDTDGGSEYDALLKQVKALRGEMELLQHDYSEIKQRMSALEESVKHSTQHVQEYTHTTTDLKEAVVSNTQNSKTYDEEYKRAYSILQHTLSSTSSDTEERLKESEAAFLSFVKQHPKHHLVSNAYYWLGQIAAEQKEYSAATKYYLQGYKSSPKGDRAQDNLLKMAGVLAITKQKSAACITLDKLKVEFSDLKKGVQNKSAELRKKLNCPTKQ